MPGLAWVAVGKERRDVIASYISLIIYGGNVKSRFAQKALFLLSFSSVFTLDLPNAVKSIGQ